jgi:hypothetical protein
MHSGSPLAQAPEQPQPVPQATAAEAPPIANPVNRRQPRNRATIKRFHRLQIPSAATAVEAPASRSRPRLFLLQGSRLVSPWLRAVRPRTSTRASASDDHPRNDAKCPLFNLAPAPRRPPASYKIRHSIIPVAQHQSKLSTTSPHPATPALRSSEYSAHHRHALQPSVAPVEKK